MREKNEGFGALARRYDRMAKQAREPLLKQLLSELADEWRLLAQVRKLKQAGVDKGTEG